MEYNREQQMEIGKQVELEHRPTFAKIREYYKTNNEFHSDEQMATWIAENHEDGFADYYTHLQKMEDELKKENENMNLNEMEQGYTKMIGSGNKTEIAKLTEKLSLNYKFEDGETLKGKLQKIAESVGEHLKEAKYFPKDAYMVRYDTGMKIAVPYVAYMGGKMREDVKYMSKEDFEKEYGISAPSELKESESIPEIKIKVCYTDGTEDNEQKKNFSNWNEYAQWIRENPHVSIVSVDDGVNKEPMVVTEDVIPESIATLAKECVKNGLYEEARMMLKRVVKEAIKTIKDLDEGDKVHGLNGYSVVKRDQNSHGNLYYAYRGNDLPEGWNEDEIIKVGGDDDIDYVSGEEESDLSDLAKEALESGNIEDAKIILEELLDEKGNKWEQDAVKHPGALHKALGISEDETIPMTLINKILSAEVGTTIDNPTEKGKKRIKVDAKLKKQANLAKTFKKQAKKESYNTERRNKM